ncbi:MAG: ABC transporter substrate-binding protein [Actinomycetota bacterium]|nr:ABC transporter substrate-binding protein [Actinomycetota bacterium]
MRFHHRRKTAVLAIGVSVAAAFVLAGAGAASEQRSERQFAGSINIGNSTTLSGAIAALGQGGLQGITLAAEDLNAKGGVLRKKVNIVSADDNATAATGASNVRSMILDKKIVALFGPVSSAVATAELELTKQYKVPTFLHISNDITLMTKRYTPYAFQLVPNTVMEPRSIAQYIKTKVKDRKLNVATFAPDYVFGRNTTANFLQALKDLGVNHEVVNQQWPALGAANIAPQLSALISSKPELTFNVQFGGDLVNFTNQAAGYGFFKDTRVIGMYALDVLKALGNQAPSYGIAFARAPYWGYKSAEMKTFVQRYKKRFGSYPNEWAIIGYSAVQAWADAATRAKSLNGDKISKALAGATVKTIRGPIRIRACDHQAEVPEFVGTIAPKADKTVGHKLWNPEVFVSSPAKTMITCAESLRLRNS